MNLPENQRQMRYDAAGNLTYDYYSPQTLWGWRTYDAENRLISANGAGNTAAYTHDAQGRRKTKTVNGTTTVFVTDAANREVLEYDGVNGAILRWYAYGLGSVWLYRATHRSGDQRSLLLPRTALLASLGPVHAAGPDRHTGRRQSLRICGQ